MATVYDESYIEQPQINDEPVKTPQFSTNGSQFDVSLSQCKNDFLCLNDKSQEMFLRKLVNTDVAVFQDHNSIIDGLFDKYCLGLCSEEKKMLAESLVQSRTKNSDHKEAPVINVAKRNVVRHNKVPKKVAQNANVAQKQIKPASGNATLSNVVKVAIVLGAVTGAIVGIKKLYNGLIVGGLDGKRVDGVNMGFLAMAYRNVVDSLSGTKLVEAASAKAAAKNIIKGSNILYAINGESVHSLAQGVDSKSKLNDFVKGLKEVNEAADPRGFFGKIFKPAPTPVFNVSEKKEIVKKVAKSHEDVKNSPLYQGVLKKTGFYDLIPSKWSSASSIANVICSLSPVLGAISPFLKFLPCAGPALAIGAQVLSFCSGPISQFIQQKQANEVK